MSVFDEWLKTKIVTAQERSLIASLDYSLFIYKQIFPDLSPTAIGIFADGVRDLQAEVVGQIGKAQADRVRP